MYTYVVCARYLQAIIHIRMYAAMYQDYMRIGHHVAM